MKSLKIAVAFILALSATPAQAEEGRWYLAGSGAVADTRANLDYAAGFDKASYDSGMGGSIYLGFKMTTGFRGEGELSMRRNKVSDINTSVGTDSGDTTASILMGNVYYDFPTGINFTPYVGAGLGVAHIQHGKVAVVASGTVDEAYWALAGQTILGVSASLSKQWDIFFDYRYLYTTDENVRNSVGTTVRSGLRSQSLNLGLRRTF